MSVNEGGCLSCQYYSHLFGHGFFSLEYKKGSSGEVISSSSLHYLPYISHPCTSFLFLIYPAKKRPCRRAAGKARLKRRASQTSSIKSTESVKRFRRKSIRPTGLSLASKAQYQIDATSRRAYQKSTYNKLSEAYDKQNALSAELQQKQAERNAVDLDPESSSGDDSEKSRGFWEQRRGQVIKIKRSRNYRLGLWRPWAKQLHRPLRR